jgi:hypothetical protein
MLHTELLLNCRAALKICIQLLVIITELLGTWLLHLPGSSSLSQLARQPRTNHHTSISSTRRGLILTVLCPNGNINWSNVWSYRAIQSQMHTHVDQGHTRHGELARNEIRLKHFENETSKTLHKNLSYQLPSLVVKFPSSLFQSSAWVTFIIITFDIYLHLKYKIWNTHYTVILYNVKIHVYFNIYNTMLHKTTKFFVSSFSITTEICKSLSITCTRLFYLKQNSFDSYFTLLINHK